MKHKEKLIRKLLKDFNGSREEYLIIYTNMKKLSINILKFIDPKYELFTPKSIKNEN